MSLSAAIAPHLPFLRRFSRAVSGSQESGDVNPSPPKNQAGRSFFGA